MKKVIVTGGAGFIGSHTAEKLIETGYKVVVIDNLSTGQLSYLHPEVKFYLADIREDTLSKIFEIEQPDYVIHLAAQMSVPYSVQNPGYDLDVNLGGLLNILQNCIKFKVKKIVFSSTGGAVYGDVEEYPTSEETTPNPMSPYAITKLASEKYLHYYSAQFGLNYCILRYANVFGPRQKTAHESGVATIFIQSVLDSKPVKIYTYSDTNEGMLRDYVYVSDVVKANIQALESDKKGIFNIGTGIATTTYGLFKEVCGITGKSVEFTLHPPRDGDIRRSCLVINKAKNILGWSPKISLNEGLKNTIDYFKK